MNRKLLVALAFVSSVLPLAVLRAQDPPRERPFPNPLLRALDADGDGRLSAEEIGSASAALKRLDADGDGALAPAEMRPAIRGGAERPAADPGPAEGRRGGAEGPGRPARPDAAPQARGGGGGDATTFQARHLAKDDAERKILDVLDDMDANQRRGMMNVPVIDGRLLRLLAEAIGAKHVVEIGTSNGYSGIWFCLALRTTGGKLTTHDVSEERAKLARENFRRAGVSDLVTLVMGDAHETVKNLEGPIDLCFIDADKEGYPDYLEKILPKMRPGGLIVAHNINQRMAEMGFIKAITENPELETLFPHLAGSGGVSVSMKKR